MAPIFPIRHVKIRVSDPNMSKAFEGLCAIKTECAYQAPRLHDRAIEQMLAGGVQSSRVIQRRKRMPVHDHPMTQYSINEFIDSLWAKEAFILWALVRDVSEKIGLYYPYDEPGPMERGESATTERRARL